jgi:hypothetical protein
MRGRLSTGAAALAVALVATSALAQEPQRPAEEDIFGKKEEPKPEPKPEEPKPEEPKPAESGPGPVTTPQTPRPAQPAPPGGPVTGADTRDEALLGRPGEGPKLSDEVAPDNPLTIGGQFYLRGQTTGQQGQSVGNWSVSSPSLLDTYFDARPNNRVRGFVLGRMFFDPTVPRPFNGIGGFDTGAPGLGGATMPTQQGPRVVLDQFWLRFDLKHTVFVTAGRQHVNWSPSRVWQPTDFLHVVKRNPLDVFDARTGSSMLKLHVPWEEKGWNFYAYGITENAGPKLADVAGALRAEVVLGTAELRAGGLFRRNSKPRWAVDLSFGVWDLDFYGELALRYASEIDRLLYYPDAPLPPNATVPQILDARYPGTFRESGIRPQTTGGVTYSHQYADKDVWTLGAEYFYNSLGYDDPGIYPGLLAKSNQLSQPPTFFYLGRQYAALFLLVPAPYSWDLTTFTFTTLGNLSDQSFISRIDYSYTLLTHLRFEAFVAIHYGHQNGEFRLGIPELNVKPGLVDLGVALRVSI